MKNSSLVFGLAVLSGASPAAACLDRRYEEHALFANRPTARLADSLQLLRVQVIEPDLLEREAVQRARVTVLEDKLGFRVGEEIRLSAYMGSSCSRWGYVRGPAYVIGHAVRRSNQPPTFSAYSFRLDQVGSDDSPPRATSQ